MRRLCLVLVFVCACVVPGLAGDAGLSGVVTDPSGGVVADARVVVRDIASGVEQVATTGADGRFTVSIAPGTYLVTVTRPGFLDQARTVQVTDDAAAGELAIALPLGGINAQVTVTPARQERSTREIPLHVETLPGTALAETNPLSTGDALANAANVTQVGNGPFGVRPRLRGLDSTRLLILVDGERLNTARTATDRAGTEVGLVSPDDIARLEVVNGAGALMYGTDALAGTINIITNEPQFSQQFRWIYGFNGYYSSNESGGRAGVTFGATGRRFAFRVVGGVEDYEDYHAGEPADEDTTPFVTSGLVTRTDTIDDNFGFAFNAFPEPFNAPYQRTDTLVPNSAMRGTSFNASGLFALSDNQTLRVRYQRRHVDEVGFPDFASPYFFNGIRLPYSNLDKASARWEIRQPAPWLANLSVTGYYQRQERLLENTLPVQFPAPAATFFPISVMRLDVLSDTEQRVWTPGLDVQALFLPATNHRLTAGITTYRDRSSDRRNTFTTTSLVGQVVLGPRGPQPVVLPSPVQLGPGVAAQPVRVPDASFRDIGIFAQDEWQLRPDLSLFAGLRVDFYGVTTKPTPGYDVASLAAGATPPIDPATLPDPNGDSYTRTALTGDIGLVARPNEAVSPFVRFGRSYRHPNLEEMLFAGPATIGTILPNVTVASETGNNFDVGARVKAGRFEGGAFYFFNHYSDFIASELVVATSPSGDPITQATNFADVRIQGLELQGDYPLLVGRGVVTLSGSAAFTRGTVTDGTNPLDNGSLAGTPQDNITPLKLVTNVRYSAPNGRYWVEWGTRSQTDVDRVAVTLIESPFVIPQDYLSLDGFTVQRIGGSYALRQGVHSAAVVVAVENLTNRFYREQFQFAPARGRTVTVSLRVGAF